MTSPIVFLPADALDLRSWKVTLPTGPKPLTPTEVKQPALSTYSDTDFNRYGNAVRFRAGVTGMTQPGSKYPRCELREMQAGSPLVGAAWSPAIGRHTMALCQQVNTLPKRKPEVVAGQIHDAAGYVLLIWVRGNGDGTTARVVARVMGQDDVELTPNYLLGTNMNLKIVAEDGLIRVASGFGLTASFPWTDGGCYFKAGCYTQSNLTTVTGEDPASYGEVLIRQLALTHVT